MPNKCPSKTLVWPVILGLSLILVGCVGPGAPGNQATPAPEISMPPTAVAAVGPAIAGCVLWGGAPVAGARVELRTGAWADPNASEVIAQAVADTNGRYALDAPTDGGEFGLVALWPDGGANPAPVTPVQVTPGDKRVEADVTLARELAWLEPVSGADVGTTPTLRWGGLPGVAQYRLWVVDAGTTELAFDLTIGENTASEQRIVLPPLPPGRTYTWDVLGLAADGALLARHTGEFRVVTLAADPLEPCRVTGHETYLDRVNGFCFAYPPRFVAQVNEAGNPVLYGPALDSNLDALRASLLIEVEVAARDRTLGAIVDGYLAQFAGLNVPAISRAPLTLGGQPAELLEVVPGREGSRDVFMLRDGTLFHLMFMPSVRDFPRAEADVEQLFDAIVSSFSLLLPETVGPGQPMPPISGDLAYARVDIAEAGLAVEVPAGWPRLEPEWVWTPSEDSALRLGLRWADLQPPQEAEAALLPSPAVTLSSEAITLSWGSGRLFTVAVYGPASGGSTQAEIQSVELHAVIVLTQEGARRAVDLYLIAPDEAQAAAQRAILRRMMNSLALSVENE